MDDEAEIVCLVERFQWSQVKLACVVGAKRGGGGGREGEIPFLLPPYPLPLSTPASQAKSEVDPREFAARKTLAISGHQNLISGVISSFFPREDK